MALELVGLIFRDHVGIGHFRGIAVLKDDMALVVAFFADFKASSD